jgi:hypothetical protein
LAITLSSNRPACLPGSADELLDITRSDEPETPNRGGFTVA